MTWAILLSMMVGVAFTNRMRGGGCPFISRLPGHPRFYAAGIVGALSMWWGLVAALTAGACFLAWSALPWGRWYDLGALEGHPNRPMSPFEALLERLTGEEDALTFTLRNLLALVPAAVLISPLFLTLALFQTAAYGVGWKMAPAAPIRLAEYLTGTLWGVFLWALL